MRSRSASSAMVGQVLFAEHAVGRAADGVAARDGDVVVDGGHVLAQTGDGGGEGGMHVQHRADLGAGLEDVAVEAPFAGGLAALQHLAVQVHAAPCSCSVISATGSADGVMRMSSPQRTEALPAVPRLRPSSTMRREVSQQVLA